MYNWEIRQTIHFNNIKMLISASFKDMFQQNLKVQKSVFLEICYCYIIDYKFVQSQLFQWQRLVTYYYNVAVYFLVQLEEDYPLIWKAKPLTIQTDKGKW